MEHNDAFIDSLDCENLLTEEQLKEILRREAEYKSGRMKVYTVEEVKKYLNYTE